MYSELDSFGSSTVPGHIRINIFVFPECQSIPIYLLPSHFPKSISCLNCVDGCQILIYWRRDHETLDCTASMESENTLKSLHPTFETYIYSHNFSKTCTFYIKICREFITDQYSIKIFYFVDFLYSILVDNLA